MNEKLTEQIVYHVLSNLGILPCNFINVDQTKCLIDNQFLLSEKITFQTDEGILLQKNIYGNQASVTDKKEFKMLLADCTQEKDIPEYALIVQLQDAPVFGVYLIFNQLVSDPPEAEAMIAVNTDKKHWIPCTVYLQATFLAGMEQIRDISSTWNKCKDYKDLHSYLLSFIKFHDNFFEVTTDEG